MLVWRRRGTWSWATRRRRRWRGRRRCTWGCSSWPCWLACGRGGLFLPLYAFGLGGVAEAFVPGAGAAETCKRVGKVLGAWLLGFVGFVVLAMIAG